MDLRRKILAILFAVASFDVSAQKGGLYSVRESIGQEDTSDLEPLGMLVKDSPLVGLGESVHTSGGFYDAKIRMMEYLIAKKGYRAIAFESPWAEAEVAQDFVANGIGTAKDALFSLFDVWNHQGLLDFFVWLRAWNVRYPNDPVVFFGIDMQNPRADFTIILQYLQSRRVANPALIATLWSCLGVGYDKTFMFNHSAEYRAIMNGARVDHDYLIRTMSALREFEGILDADTNLDSLHARALNALISLASFHEFIVKSPQRPNGYQHSFELRDRAMANLTVLQWKRLAPNKKVILWAHNLHIERGIQSLPSHNGFNNLGFFLTQQFGNQYYPILLTAKRVETEATKRFVAPIVPASWNHIENILAKAGNNSPVILDVNSNEILEDDKIYYWGGEHHLNGEVYPAETGRIRQACSAIFFMPHSGPSIRVK